MKTCCCRFLYDDESEPGLVALYLFLYFIEKREYNKEDNEQKRGAFYGHGCN